MRALILLATLSACGTSAPQADPQALAIPCAPDRGPPATCGVTREMRDGITLLTVTEPAGGFRRLAVGPDGAVRTADGAIAARATVAGDRVEVTVEDDRYSLPAR